LGITAFPQPAQITSVGSVRAGVSGLPGSLRRKQRYRGDLLLGQVFPADAGGRPWPVPSAAVDDTLGCDDEVDRHIVAGHRDRPGREYLEFVDGGDRYGG